MARATPRYGQHVRGVQRRGLRDLMARMGTTASAAMIYQHEARGADQAITRAIDTHVQVEQANDDDDDGSAGVLAPVGSQARRPFKPSVVTTNPAPRSFPPVLAVHLLSGFAPHCWF